jgi:hypothetical protein
MLIVKQIRKRVVREKEKGNANIYSCIAPPPLPRPMEKLRK